MPKVDDVINKAIRQMKKNEKKAKDMAPDLTVRTTLILPYVSSDQLKRVLDCERHFQLRRNLFEALKATSTDEAVKLCLLSDQLSHPDTPWDVTPDVLSKLGAWWDLRMACTEDPSLTDQSYLDFVTKLVGPATTITVQSDSRPRNEVRTAGEAAAELARRLVTFVLTLEQVGLMDRNPRLICLTGPPGTGKTVVMELQGLRWLLEGRNVHLVSTSRTSRAINIHIEHQLNMMVSDHGSQTRTPGSVHRHEYDFYQETDYPTAVGELLACVKNGTLHILMDEANFTESANDGKRNRSLVTELIAKIPGLHLWAARIGNHDVPRELKEENLRLPLRSAPSVLREVEKAFCVYDDITKYSNNGVPSPADGLDVIRLSHHGDGHNGLWPDECEQCGRNVAVKLHSLGVGGTGRMVDTCPDPLRYGDVFVLTRSLDLQDDVTDKKGKAIPASGFVRGLRDAGVDLQVCVLGRPDFKHDRARWERDMADVAVGKMNKVTVAYSTDMQGLERPVVVWLHGRRKGSDKTENEKKIVAQDRLVAASRAMAQLIVVGAPDEPNVNISEVPSTNITPTDVTATIPTTTDVTTEASPTDVTTFEATPSDFITSDASPTDVPC
ncbi:uncharacterized protein [Littorina saxatilis]|uniref:uncharacterized protein n=1 Tax=Littorina saxatilis TaxID=31220 RepID=UPI0038B619CD